jgi:hypothetical protein
MPETTQVMGEVLDQYNAFVLGLTFLRRQRPEVLARRGNSIGQALRHAQVLSESQRKTLGVNMALVSQVMRNAETMRGNRQPPKRKVEERCGITDLHLLLLVIPDKAVQYDWVLGPKGKYLLVVTEAGMAYADGIAPQYSELLTPEKFMAGWQGFVKQVQATAMRERRQGGRGAPPVPRQSSDDETAVRVTQTAKYTEADFEW